jgi:hypothetical protein
MSLYALGWLNPKDHGDFWTAKILDSAIDASWPTHKWPAIDAAAVEATLPPTYPDTSLGVKTWDNFYFNTPGLITQLNTHITNGKISVRTQREGGSTDHLFNWDAGVGDGSKGPKYAPTLSILYTTNSDNTGPTVSNFIATPNPTGGKQFTNFTAKITDDKSRVLYAEWFWGTSDPGLGKGMPAAALGGAMKSKVINVSQQIDVSTFSDGDFTISLRGMDESGNWGTVGTLILHVSGSTVPEPVLVLLPGLTMLALVIVIVRKTIRGEKKSD